LVDRAGAAPRAGAGAGESNGLVDVPAAEEATSLERRGSPASSTVSSETRRAEGLFPSARPGLRGLPRGLASPSRLPSETRGDRFGDRGGLLKLDRFAGESDARGA
jgi:hypothetical protein